MRVGSLLRPAVVAGLLALAPLTHAATEIRTLDQAKAAAAAEHRLILLDGSADW